MSGNRQPQRVVQHEIDEAARRCLRDALPTAWVYHERSGTNDYGIDGSIEVFNDGVSQGLEVAVQQKGETRPKFSGQFVKYTKLSTGHIKYYLTRDDPVFLVLVDVENRTPYYLFIQQHMLENLADRPWRRQQSVTLHIPVANDLRDSDRFKSEAHRARSYMAGCRAGAIPASISKEQKKWESLDPRFRVLVKASEGAIHYSLQPKTTVPFTLTFKGDQQKYKAFCEEFLGRGRPIVLNPGDVEVDGSLLLKEVIESQAIMMKPYGGIDGSMRFTAVKSDNHLVARVETTAFASGGTAELRISAELPEAPFKTELRLKFDEGLPSDSIHLLFSFQPSRWFGKPVLELPYFEDIFNLFAAIESGCDLNLEFYQAGNRLFGSRVANAKLTTWRAMLSGLSVLRNARLIAMHLRVNPLLPRKLDELELAEIEQLHWLVMPGERRTHGEGISFTLDMLHLNTDAIRNSPGGPLVLKTADEPVQFLGTTVPSGPVEYELTHVELARPLDELMASTRGNSDPIAVTVVGTKQSEFIVRRPATQEAFR